MITLNKSLAISVFLHLAVITISSLNIFYRPRTMQWNLSPVELVNITSREMTEITQGIKDARLKKETPSKPAALLKESEKSAKKVNLPTTVPAKPEKIFRRIAGPPKISNDRVNVTTRALPTAVSPAAGVGTGTGVPSISVEVQRFPFTYYLEIIKSKVNQNWRPQKGVGKAEVTVFFKIMKEGNVKEVAVEKSSGVSFLDQSAVRAIIQSGPFPSLPIGFGDDYLKVHLKFKVEEFDF